MYHIVTQSRFYAKKAKPPKKGLLKSIKQKLNNYLFPKKCLPALDPVPSPDCCAVDPKWKQPRIIIIGAGMAGLSAAQRLLQCGISNFLILEATDRPGGRIHSRWMGDCMTELGAMWIEGASVSNLIFQLATQEGLVTPPLKRFKIAEDTTFFTECGRAIEKETADMALRTFQELVEAKAVLSELVRQCSTLGEFFEKSLNNEYNGISPQYKTDILHVTGSLYNELRNRIGEDLNLVNPRALSEMQHLPGGRIRIPLGFGSVLAPLLRILPPCTIMYCKPVHFIQWDEESKTTRAKVVCSDKEEFPADYVIITVSLGVLKQDVCTMFTPALPRKKLDAIKYLGYADVERIFIQYEKPFWSGNMSIGLGWQVNQLKDRGGDWTSSLSELTSVPGSTATLHGMVSSYPATVLSSTSISNLIPKVGKLVRKFTGDNTLPDPINVQRSNWSDDPFFSGSYTYLGLESEPEHLLDLAEPIPNSESGSPLLMFAGEATSRYYFSTVHGARESGIREAQRIINATNIFKGPPVAGKPCPPCDKKYKECK